MPAEEEKPPSSPLLEDSALPRSNAPSACSGRARSFSRSRLTQASHPTPGVRLGRIAQCFAPPISFARPSPESTQGSAMRTLATKSPGPANVPDRGKPVVSTESPESAELFGSTRAPVPAKSPGRAKAAGSEELAGPIVVRRPPAQLLAPSPAPEERIPRSFPHTTPERPWDRLCVAARKPSKTTWDEEGPRLEAELPPDAPKGTSLIGSIVILVVEVLLGHRPATALRHWLTPEVYGPVARRAGLAAP